MLGFRKNKCLSALSVSLFYATRFLFYFVGMPITSLVVFLSATNELRIDAAQLSDTYFKSDPVRYFLIHFNGGKGILAPDGGKQKNPFSGLI